MNRLRTIIISTAVFFFLSHGAYAQSTQPVLMQLTTDDGLSFNAVYSIIQDKEGFMWFGTYNGIDRYDGIEIKKYRNRNIQGLHAVICMTLDSLGNLWHGAILHKYDPKTDKKKINYFYVDSVARWASWFTDMTIGPDNRLYLAGNNRIYTRDPYTKDSVVHELFFIEDYYDLKSLNRIGFDTDDNLWLGTNNGLFIYNLSKKDLVRFGRVNYPEQKYVKDFLFAENGDLWIVFTDQIMHYSFLEDKSATYTIKGIRNPDFTRIYQGLDGTIWAGTMEEGLFYLDKGENQFICLLEQQSISALYEDRSGRLWIGTDNAGIFVYDSLRNFFPRLPVSVSDKAITTFQANDVVKSKDGRGLWIGTVRHGLLYYDLSTRNTSIIDPENLNDFLYQDEKGKIWYADLKYLKCYDPANGSIKKTRHPLTDQMPVNNYGNQVRCIVEFEGKFIISSDYGLVFSYDPVTGKFDTVFKNENPVREMIARNDTLYIAAYQTGVVRMNRYLTIIDTVSHNNPGEAIAEYAFFKLYFDRYDTLWAGGFGGVGKFNPQTRKLETKFDLSHPMDYIIDILEDSLGNLWISSVLGLYKYDRVNQSLRLFNSNNGLPPGRIWKGSAHVTPEGLMFFGGNNGIFYFNPYLVKTNPEPPPLVFTDFIIHSGSGKDSIRNSLMLKKSINCADRIRLDYRQNSFIIKFAALNYTSSHHNRYRYKLEGLDDEWHDAGNLSQASYTNLDGGRYTFYVKACNNDGLWNEEARNLQIVIDSPPWKRGWAYSIYLLLAAGIVLAIYYYNIRRIRIQHQLDIKTRESEYLQEIDRAKTDFFTNISHELRTPLTLIIDPANQLMQDENISTRQENLISLILRNSQRLLFLINQILDLARLRNTKLMLQAEETDIVAFLKPILHAFTSRAEALALKYSVDLPDKEIKLWIDKEKIERTIINLVSNAFKFCFRGEVRVRLQEESDKVVINVEDTGMGIPADKLDRIFENYYRVETPDTRDIVGTGIGLYLVKEYIRLHQGKIEVKSEENKGSVFTVILVKGNKHLSAGQMIRTPDSGEPATEATGKITTPHEDRSGTRVEFPVTKPVVLVIEDNPEMTKYLIDSLSREYRMISAVNGVEGYDKTLEDDPDVVICDVMMPLMDGFTYCQKVKGDIKTSHVPVIMLTARNLDDDKIRGLTLGADDYMIKPFQMTELKLRINYHLEQREKIRAQFLRDFKFKSEKEFIRSLKDQFLQKLFTCVEEHYKDDLFGVEKLSDLMAMSKKHLNHKVKILTDQTTNELIRNFRLRKAAYLLSEGSGSVTQICYETGFNNPSYFSRCFKEYFGKHPSEYQENKR